jgi:hypothetical protein
MRANDVNLFGDNTNTTKKSTEALIHPSKEACLEVNTEKTECMLLYRCQNAGQNHDIKIPNRSYENLVKFEYFGTAFHS